MKKKDVTDLIAFVVLVFVIGAFAIGLFGSIAHSVYQESLRIKACADAGFVEHVSHSGSHYCYKQVNGTDVLVPLEDAVSGDWKER